MIKWPQESLYFAVIDGDDPKNWQPWDGEESTFGSLCDAWKYALPQSISAADEPKASFSPLTDPIAKILETDRLRSIVGVIIEAKADPSDLPHYEEKMRLLQKLCLHMRHARNPETLLIDKVAFEVWFFINGLEIERWEQWSTRAKNIVYDTLSHMPRVEWVPTGSMFPQLARRLLADSRYSLMWGKR